VGWKTTVASIVVEGTSAVNQLLFGKRIESSVFDEGGGFKASNSGEGPARSTVSLILDWGDSSNSSPIPG